MDISKIKTKTVCSATNWYLFVGIIGIILLFMLESSVIYNFMVEPLAGAVSIGVLLQLPAFVCIGLILLIKDWKNRTKFNIYYMKLETGTDIDHIKKNYAVVDISTTGILFVEKEDVCNFHTWNLFQGYRRMWEIEERWFKTEKDDIPNNTKFMKAEVLRKQFSTLMDIIVIEAGLTLNECVDKQIPAKPLYDNYDEDDNGEKLMPYKATCPVCGNEFESGTWNNQENHHCTYGQKMNWH